MGIKKNVKIYIIIIIICFCNFINPNIINADVKQTIEDGIYIIKSAQNEKYVLDVTENSLLDAANIELWENNFGYNQKFKITYIGNGYYTIGCVESGKYLDVHGCSNYNGANVEQFTFNDGDNQKWVIKDAGNGYYNIISKCNNLCIDATKGIMNNGTNIEMWEQNGGENQKFKFIKDENKKNIEEGIYKIAYSENTKYVLNVINSSKNNGANIELNIDNNEDNQKFKITKLANNYYSIVCINSGKALDVHGGYNYNGVNLEQYDVHNNDNQKWIIEDAGNENYNIISKCNNLCVDITKEIIEKGTNIEMWEQNGGKNQKFKFIKTEITCKNEINGIDVSHHQGNIDWKKVKEDNIDFAIIRAGYRGYGQAGTLNTDTKYYYNISNAIQNDIDVGVYFFSQAINEKEAKEEANYILNLIKGYKITYPVIIDVEYANEEHSGRADNVSKQTRTQIVKTFCNSIKQAGYIPMFYADKWFATEKLDLNELTEYEFWLAHYTGATKDNPYLKKSDYTGKYSIWQYTSKGTVKGINTQVDLNVSNKSF